MPGKMKAKDLSYDTSLPPFLQRLHDQKAGRGDTDRHERPLARPMRAKDPNDDDGPTVVDESGETVSKMEYEKLTAADTQTVDTTNGGNVDGETRGDDPTVLMSGALPVEDGKKGGVVATSGLVAKKRKAARIVGDADGETASKAAGEKEAVAKPKKKAKHIKLAFDDGEEG
ncbi:hypothetical protein LTR91_002925 [Friedmanniomyces endolithicus]|uniref:DUF4604 domain-containing protein n=1 Tax=Friedmanniomyces endolithicus TaxID=329885 RepID=A0AAN6L0A7_9PEZI|nr:hypothetical protein LTR94_006446 [Friedmanniomyces endolithicus]KAK0767971.1 hypothetical protein LTR59_018026 [Friedmanniomyces endolithicus]KAK0786007.1 hypothetical protein LTR38_012177 [Friedmanniomyces endolithicus]KAK0814537.1 hypothetical protein LTR75_004245 [Friedmanniomyces endolithicus]KAK0850572.1 hypothetical protein LTR03_004544 [Friedmanniomyces endolithicus]